MLKKFLIFLVLSLFGTLAVLSLSLYWLVAMNPGENLSRGFLEKVLAVESPVYYRDGTNKIGVFFERSHRQYLHYNQIPVLFIKSIVAAEDRKFYDHWGVDFLGIARAMYANLKAGRVVQGGSTLTQQTAKNLYKRQGRSFKAKAIELLNAWRLEYRYSKDDILEFYSNQFYVSGNGRGLGVAARYYFDKPASELTLVECAFIAGSVKRPNYYNPFIKKDPEKRKIAQHRAKARCRYVLERMFELGMLNSEELQKGLNQDIPFQQGRMSYAVNTIMDMVKEALTAPEIEEALVDAGIDNIATSGIRIITTIEKNIQERSLFGLRKELSRLSVRMKGYDNKKLQKSYRDLAKENRELASSAFVFGRIKEVGSFEEPFLAISLLGKQQNHKEAAEGVVDAAGLRGVLASLVKYNRNRWSEIKEADMAPFLAGFSKGDLVYVSIREYDAIAHRFRLELERYPEIQGGVVAMEGGAVRAMVGGNENRFFNRVRARRVMGSISKPLLYTAAIQLGWNSMDILNNTRDAFIYNGQTYFPSPDHHSQYEGVSLNWAGTKSENVASVWLLYHLCDRLTSGQFKEVVRKLGLARLENESYQHYRVRIRDEYGQVVNHEQLAALALEKAIVEIDPDLLFAGKSNESDFLHGLHYQFADNLVSRDKTGKEADFRRRIVKTSYISLQGLAAEFAKFRSELNDPWRGAGRGGAKLYFDAEGQRYAYGLELPGDVWHIADIAGFTAKVKGAAGRWDWGAVLLAGKVSLDSFNLLQNAQEIEARRIGNLPRYGTEVLYQLRDFRVFVGLHYLISLCHEMGIESPLEAVLSFPLGSNVITLFDVVRSYNTMVEGTRVTVGRADAGESIALIDRIEDPDGKIIYRPPILRKDVVDKYTSLVVSNILRNVVKYGTGRGADREVVRQSHYRDAEKQFINFEVSLPIMGKTGTANGYRNSSFAGFVPGLVAGENMATTAGGYVVASYVGYDDNRPMIRKSTRIAGSSGALPVWNRVANAIIRQGDYITGLDLASLLVESPPLPGGRLQIPLIYPALGQITVLGAGMAEIVVDDLAKMSYLKRYKTLKYGDSLTVFADVDRQGNIRPERHFIPYWHLDK